MNTIRATFAPGLLLIFLILFGVTASHAQILRNVTGASKDAGTTVTSPLKDARGTVKDIGSVPRDISKAKKDVVKPVSDINKEVDGLKNDINKTKDEYNDMKGNRARTKEEKEKEAAGKATADSLIDDAQLKEQARIDSVAGGRQRTGTMNVNSAGTENATTETPASDPSRTVLLPPTTISTPRPQPTRTRSRTGRTGSTTRTRTTGTTRTSPNTGTTTQTRSAATSPASSTSSGSSSSTRTAPVERGTLTSSLNNSARFASSPARRQLESSKFDMETLQDLFEAAIWTGPDSVHTARSIDYMLQQYRMDIDEVKRLDPNWDTTGHEDRYQKWMGLYQRNIQPIKEN